MNPIYYVDAYNLIRSTHRWDSLPVEQKRQSLLEFLGDHPYTGRQHHTVVVVFDGHPASVGKVSIKNIRIMFSYDLEADDIIKTQVDALKNPRNAFVITNDRALQKWVQGAGATIVPCTQFLRINKPSKNQSDLEKPDFSLEQSINDELKRLWKLK